MIGLVCSWFFFTKNKPVKQGWYNSCVDRFECKSWNNLDSCNGCNGFGVLNGKVPLKESMAFITLMAFLALKAIKDLTDIKALISEILSNPNPC